MAPQLRIWTWGPTMLCFAIAALAAAPCLLKEQRSRTDNTLIVLGLILSVWVCARALLTPVYEASRSDLLLLSMAISTFLCFRACLSSKGAQRVLIFGITGLLAASVWVITKQIFDPLYSPIFPNKDPKAPAGFFAHYSYGASFLIATSLILSGFALFSKAHFTSKVLFGLVSLAGMVAIYFTKSRGGFIGIGAGVGVLLFASLLVGSRDKKRWFGPAVIILPIIFIGLAILFLSWLSQVQEARGDNGQIAGMLDNSIRLYMIGIAFSTIGLHPIFGGGSRSFSWECFQFWDTTAMGWGRAKPEHVHNEFIQTVTDYGIFGASILFIFLLIACLLTIIRLTTEKNSQNEWSVDAWRVGGLAAFAGLFVQSCFEGIFRIPPGAAMLGLCISVICIPIQNSDLETRRFRLNSLVLSLIAFGLAIPLSFFGWKAYQVSQVLWPSYFPKTPLSVESNIDRLSNALTLWELPSLYKQRANLGVNLAGEQMPGEFRDELFSSALADFRKAAEMQPYDPELAVGAANILSFLNRNTEAEKEFQRACLLQGEMEPTFFARSWYARHLCEKGYTELDDQDPTVPLNTFQLAAAQTDWLMNLFGVVDYSQERKITHVRIRQGLGLAYERLDDFKSAISQYEKAAELPGGSSSYYLAGTLYGKIAVKAWSERRSADALRLFNEAELRIVKSTEIPNFVTPEAKADYLAYLRKSINFLKGAKVKPAEKINF
ncbi:MAG: O-antigen ligase family protein [Akkermansiaceae bacterium]